MILLKNIKIGEIVHCFKISRLTQINAHTRVKIQEYTLKRLSENRILKQAEGEYNHTINGIDFKNEFNCTLPNGKCEKMFLQAHTTRREAIRDTIAWIININAQKSWEIEQTKEYAEKLVNELSN